MANDRMYLRCDTCGAQKLIAKTFGRGWKVWRVGITSPLFKADKELDEELDEWFEAHLHGNPNQPWFSLKYELKDNA